MKNTIVRAVATRTGADLDSVQAIANGLEHGGAWPSNQAQALTNLMLALMAEADPRSAASVARHFYSLSAEPFGKAGDMIQDAISAFLDQRESVGTGLHAAFEIYSTDTPQITMRVPLVNRIAEVVFSDGAEHQRTNRFSNFLTVATLQAICDDIVSGAHE